MVVERIDCSLVNHPAQMLMVIVIEQVLRVGRLAVLVGKDVLSGNPSVDGRERRVVVVERCTPLMTTDTYIMIKLIMLEYKNVCMTLANIVRQGYRVYGLALLAWAGWSGLWIITGLNMDPSIVGYGWLTITVFGAILTVSMGVLWYMTDYTLFKKDRHQRRVSRFNNHMLSSTPLHVYVLVMIAWSLLTVEWWVLNLGLVERTVVGFGWLLIAVYGLALTLGLSVKHKDDIVETVDEVTPASVEMET
jgi:hypothetical protein